AGALWADIIAIGAVGYGVEAVAGSVVGGDIVAAGGLAYFIVLWATTGRTLGMWLAGLRVVRQDSGRRLGLARSVIRMAGFFLNAASVFVGFAWAGVDRRKQGWHDKMAGSLVVRRID
ncbi:MAG: RDD family protein, partial [Candidatus Dormibacteria bacterium]